MKNIVAYSDYDSICAGVLFSVSAPAFIWQEIVPFGEDFEQALMLTADDVKPESESQDAVAKHISVQAGDKIIVQKILNEQEHIHASFFTDGSFQKILLYLGIMINRSMQGGIYRAVQQGEQQ